MGETPPAAKRVQRLNLAYAVLLTQGHLDVEFGDSLRIAAARVAEDYAERVPEDLRLRSGTNKR